MKRLKELYWKWIWFLTGDSVTKYLVAKNFILVLMGKDPIDI